MRETASMTCRIVASPLGAIRLTAGEEALEAITIIGGKAPDDASGHPLLDEAAAQLAAYFAGTLEAFDLPLAPLQSERGNALRAAIVAIPYGEVQSYGEVAHRIGSGPRAIGQACRRNPFPIVVPCHRVIGAKGSIGHYSGGEGVETKRHLLQLENRKEPRLWAA